MILHILGNIEGQALGAIQQITDDAITIQEAELEKGEESTFEVPLANAANAIRPMVTTAEADELLRRIAQPWLNVLEHATSI